MTKDIILLHGWGGTKQSLTPLAQALEEQGFKTHVLEMPGHGETPQMNEPWHMVDYAQWLQKYIHGKELKDYILIGHSFGGRIILHSVINKVINPEKIVLIDASGVKPNNSFKKSMWKSISKIGRVKAFEPIKPLIYKYVIGETDYSKTSGNLKETFKIVNEAYYDDLLSTIQLPTLIIWGKDDTITPLWMGEQLSLKIKNSKLEIMNGSHSLPLQNPQGVSQLINNFISHD